MVYSVKSSLRWSPVASPTIWKLEVCALWLPSPFHPHQPLAATDGFSVSMSLAFCFVLFRFFRFHIKVRWYGTCLSVTYFTQLNTLKAYSCCDKWKYFLLFYSWVVFHCVCVCVSHFVNNAAENMRVHVFFHVSVFIFFG